MNGFVDSDKARENRVRRVEKLRQSRNRIETQSAFAIRKWKVRQTCVRPTIMLMLPNMATSLIHWIKREHVLCHWLLS